MNNNMNNPGRDQEGPDGVERQDDELNMGNDLSLGSVSGSGISDFDPEKDETEAEEKEKKERNYKGDDQRSDDNGINPDPSEVDPEKNLADAGNVENAGQDKLSPYPDEQKTEDDDEKLNSTWFISGRNRKI